MRLIDADALVYEFKGRCICECDSCKYQRGAYCGLIDNAPTIEQPTGEWIKDSKTYDKHYKTVFYSCSICGHLENCVIEKSAFEQNPFCKICGAKMKGGENE